MAGYQEDHMDENELMRQLKNGELDRAADLYSLYNKKLFNYFLKSTYDRDLSHDLTQTVFYRMIRYRRSFRGTSPFRAWIYQITRNVIAEHFRKRNKESLHVNAALLENGNETMENTSDHLERLERAMRLLNRKQREILVLSKLQKMKYRDLALVMNTTESNIKIRVYRAMIELRKVFERIET